ncbi:MAG: pantetheine-phosphate adenylyltransferase [Acidobacteriota bacterium]
MSDERIGVYPGTFDPITNGHTDIILRATKIVDRLVIGVARNIGKGPLFSTEERVEIVTEEIAHLADAATRKRVEVRPFENLLMHFAMEVGASVIVRGLRAVSDFEYEFQMAGMNNRLNSKIETVFLMANDRYQFISSRFVKEIAQLGGDVSHFVSPRVVSHIAKRLGRSGAPKRARSAAAKR